jgi:hypothetical protein
MGKFMALLIGLAMALALAGSARVADDPASMVGAPQSSACVCFWDPPD